MRHIGINGIECFDGPCKPWAKFTCHNCPIRPMKVYQGNGNAFITRDLCKANGYGILISPGGASGPENFPYYAIDNGAYSAWVNGVKWDADKFLAMLERLIKRAKPDFVVCPDKVAGGQESLSFSLKWVRDLPEGKYYLAVQDGMTLNDVEPIINRFAGLFVGGSLDWKLATSPQWIMLAHKHLKPCHIGRVGTWNRIVWAARIGADSIDSSSWAHNDSFHHLEYAKMQQCLEVTQNPRESDK